MRHTGAQFHSKIQDAPRGSAILNEQVDGILRMLRTGAPFSEQLAKIRRPNFEDAPHESAIFEAVKNQKTQKSRLVSHGSAIFE